MNFSRERWVVFRNLDNKIFCGSARNYEWRDLEDIGNARVVTYMSEKKAISSVTASYGYKPEQVKAERVFEKLVSADG
jgi:hypothetical protein